MTVRQLPPGGDGLKDGSPPAKADLTDRLFVTDLWTASLG